MDNSSPRKNGFSFDSSAAWLAALTVPVAGIFFLPLASVPILSTKTSLLALGVIVTFVAYIVARLVRGNIIVPPLLLFGFMWLVPLAYLLSTLFSGIDPLRAFFGTDLETDTFGFVLLLAFLGSLCALALRDARHYKNFFTALFAGLFIVVIAQIGIVLFAQMSSGLSPTVNLVGSFSDLGMVVGLGIALALLALRSLSLPKIPKVLLWVGILLGLFVLVLVNSAVVWVLVALVAGALFIEAIMHRHNPSSFHELEGVSMLHGDEPEMKGEAEPRQLAGPLVALLVALFFVVGGTSIANTVASSLGVNMIDVRPSWQSTFTIGGHTYASSPLFGSGPGTFGDQWLQFRDRTLNDTVFWNIDFSSGIGYIPTSFVTTGVLGVLAWLAFLGLFLYTGFRALLFRLPEEPFVRFVSLASFTGALFVFALAFAGAPGPIVLAFGFTLLGVFISTLRYGKGKEEWGIVFSRAPRVGFVVVFLLTLSLLGAVGTLYVVAERYVSSLAYTESVALLSAGDIDKAEQEALRSISLAPSDRAYRLLATIGIERMSQIAQNTELPATTLQEQFQAALSNSVSAGIEATRLGANNYQNWAVLGNVYRSVAVLDIDGAYESAKDAYATAITLNPTSPILPYILAQLEVGETNLSQAEAHAEEAVNLKRDYVPAILLLAQLKIQLNKGQEALQAAEAAAFFAPEDPAVLLQVGLLRSGIGEREGAIQALSRAVELNPQFANARFFLAAMYALSGDVESALRELRVIADFSEANATAVAPDISALEAGENPFSLQRLRSLGMPQPPVAEPTPTPSTGEAVE